MYKHLAHLTELSLELSNQMETSNRVEDSLEATKLHSVEDISTESSSAFMRAIGLQRAAKMDKVTLIMNLEAIQTQVAKETLLKSKGVDQALLKAVDYLRANYESYTPKLPNSARNVKATYTLDTYDRQTAQQANRIGSLDEFIHRARKLQGFADVVTGELRTSILFTLDRDLHTPDPGHGTRILKSIGVEQPYLNNTLFKVITHDATGRGNWTYKFTTKRNDGVRAEDWTINYDQYHKLHYLLQQYVEFMETLAGRLSLEQSLRKSHGNKRHFELYYQFYIPIIITCIRVVYLISELLSAYRKELTHE